MDAQRFSTHVLGMDTSGIGEPVVSVDDIKLLCPGHHASDDRVVIDFLVQVFGVSSGKLHTSEVVHMHVVEVGIDMVAQFEVIVGVHDVPHPALHIVVVYIPPCDRNGTHTHDFAGRCVLIAKWLGQAQCDIHVALGVQSFRDSIISGSESTVYMRRILPSKH